MTSAKKTRPSMLDDYMVGGRTDEVESEPSRRAEPTNTPEGASFRTSMYFNRKVHEKLRAIAFERRLSVAEIVHEALDLWLVKEGFPTTGKLKEG